MSLARSHPEVLDTPEQNHETMLATVVPFPVKIYDGAGRMNAAIRLIDALGQEYDAAQIQVILKSAGEIITHSLELNKEACLFKLTDKETLVFGAKITTRRSTEYDYSDTPLVEACEIHIEEEKKKLKDLKDQLKNLPAPEVVNPTTGEIYRKARLVKDGIIPAVSLPK